MKKPKPTLRRTSLRECVRRADKLGLTYGEYMGSRQHELDVSIGGYFEKQGFAVECKKKEAKK